MSVLAVTGTDTGVGKTVVTAALAAAARAQGRNVAVVKPAQTGVAPGEPGDVDEVRRLSGVADVHELSRFPDPLAPATAARRAGGTGVRAGHVAELVRELARESVVLVEGAGGLLVRLGEEGDTLADVASAVAARVLVVVRAGLGTLNHAALTCEALRARGLACAGLVVGAWPAEPDLAARCNLEDLADYTGEALVGRVPEGAARMAPEAFAREAQTWIRTEELL